MEILLEKYVGKRPECLLMEKEFAKLRKKLYVLYDPSKPLQLNSGGLKKINNSDEVKKISILIEKLFNLNEAYFFVDPDPRANAYTPAKSFIFLDRNVKKSKSGEFSGSGNLNIGIAVTLGILLNKNVTDAELVGVVLHEAGHNFYRSPIQVLSRLSVTQGISTVLEEIVTFGLLDIIDLALIVQKGKSLIRELIDKIPGYTSIKTTLIRTLGTATSLMPSSFNVIKDIPGSVKTILSSPMQPIFRYNMEKFADNFATDYGYGQEVATIQAKFEFDKQTLRHFAENNNTPIGLFYQLDSTIYGIFSSIVSGYPSDQNRVRTALTRMEKSVNDPSLPPKLKAELQTEIKETRDWYENEYLKANEDDKRALTIALRNVLEKLFKGKADIREIIIIMDKEQKEY